MKIHAFYTPSHAPLIAEHFLPTAVRIFGENNVSCRPSTNTPQGSYGSPEFNECCLEKVHRNIKICESASDPIVLSDVDVRFYGDVPSDLKEYSEKHDHDAYFQWDGPSGHCTGFVFVRRPKPYAQLLRRVSEVMLSNPRLEDQQALKHLIVRGEHRLSFGILPTCKYWTDGTKGRAWEPGDPLRPPNELLMHHGNWTSGVDNKMRLLSAVARIREAR
jgi:hypothetical protein